MEAKVRRLVLDVLKPHDPSIIEVSQLLAGLPGVDGVNINIYEVDRKVENAKITVMGPDVDWLKVLAVIEDTGGTVHSIVASSRDGRTSGRTNRGSRSRVSRSPSARLTLGTKPNCSLARVMSATRRETPTFSVPV